MALREELVVADLAAAQWGLLTSTQAAQRGVSRLQLSRLAAAGLLDRVAHGVYRLRGAGEDVHADLRAAWLSLDPARTAEQRLADPTGDVVVSHASAAALHGLGDINADQHELTAPVRRQTQRNDLRLHRGRLDRDDVTIVDGLPVTTPARTVVDLLADKHDTDHVATVLAEAVRAGTVDLDTLPARLAPYAARHGHRPGDGEALLAALLERVGLDDATLREQILASEPGRQLADGIALTSIATTLRALSDQLTGSVTPDVLAALHRAGAHPGNDSPMAALMASDRASDLIKTLGVHVEKPMLAKARPMLDAIAASQGSSPAWERVRAQLAAAVPDVTGEAAKAQLAQTLAAVARADRKAKDDDD
jgi:predicted transcriptional regulator of viral defense system